MYDSPDSLQDLTADFISKNVSDVFSTLEGVDGRDFQYTYKDNFICMPCSVSELLFTTLEEKNLTDELLTIFDPSFTRLRQVYIKIRNPVDISLNGLRILHGHNIKELAFVRSANVSVSELIGCLGEWTVKNLRTLNISQSTYILKANSHSKYISNVMSILNLKNLRCLDLSFTLFNTQGLELIASDLPCLESLNISCTLITDISPLKQCSDRLRSLNMYNVKVMSQKETLHVISKLEKLCHLDFSQDLTDIPRFQPFPEENKSLDSIFFSEVVNCLPLLVSLDLSGRKSVDVTQLKSYLKKNRKIQFLGLMNNSLCLEETFWKTSDPIFNPNLVITGFATVEQILESLQRYMIRELYVQKSLCSLYVDIQDLPDVRPDIIDIVHQCMKIYPKVLAIQMAATACMYKLTKGVLSSKIHPKFLAKVVNSSLASMEQFPNKMQIQKNTLLTLCSDRMLQDVTFNRYRCAELVMNALMKFDDPAMNRMSVAICSILASRISTAESSNLGAKTDYMIRLLDIVKTKANQGSIDMMMKFTLSALWNLTDESPKTCGVFLDLGGLQLFLDVLQKFPGESSVETKVLGLMNNIAEVPHLRESLMEEGFISVLRLLLQSPHIDVSYFAAGITAHLASEGEQFWVHCKFFNWKEIIDELGLVVLNWEIPSTEMVAYRSFSPFYALFDCYEAYQVQLWAAWAIHHVCLKNPKRYCRMIMEEGGVEKLDNVLKIPSLNSSVADFCNQILKFIQEEFPNI